MLAVVVGLIVSELTLPGSSSLRTIHATNFHCNTIRDIPVSECNALVTLYTKANGTGWLIAGLLRRIGKPLQRRAVGIG